MLANPGDDSIDVARVYDDRLNIVASASSKWAKVKRLKLVDLNDAPWCLPTPTNPAYTALSACFRKAGLNPPEPVISVSSPQLTTIMISSYGFVGVLGDLVLKLALSKSSLKRLPLDIPRVGFSACIVSLKDRTLSPVAKLFIKTAREVAREVVNSGT